MSNLITRFRRILMGDEAELETGITPTGIKNITENGTYDVTEYASAEVNVSTGVVPTGTKTITQNGTYDVTEFAEANVNVSLYKNYTKEVTIQTVGSTGALFIDVPDIGTWGLNGVSILNGIANIPYLYHVGNCFAATTSSASANYKNEMLFYIGSNNAAASGTDTVSISGSGIIKATVADIGRRKFINHGYPSIAANVGSYLCHLWFTDTAAITVTVTNS